MKIIMSFFSCLLLAVFGGMVFQCCLWTPERIDVPCPEIIDFSSSGALIGSTFTIKGHNFYAMSPNLYAIRIGDTDIPESDLKIPDSETIQIKIPNDISNGTISIEVKNAPYCGKTLSKKEFIYPCPQINSFSPSGAPFDAIITVKGSNFYANDPALYSIRIGTTDIPPANIEVPDANTIRIKVPKDTKNGKISIEFKTQSINCQVESAQEFVYYYTATLVEKLPTATTPLDNPAGLAVDNFGNIIVADQGNNVIRKINTNGILLTTYGNGIDDCNSSPTHSDNASFYSPADVAVDADGSVYVADQGNSVIRLFSSLGSNPLVLLYAGRCQTSLFIDGLCGNSIDPARLSSPSSLVKDNNGVIYMADNGAIRKIETPCNLSTLLPKTSVKYFQAIAISRARSGAGPLFVADVTEKNIKSVTLNGDQCVAINTIPPNLLSMPMDLAIDKRGNIFVADASKNQIFVIYTDGVIQALAGTGQPGTTDMVPGTQAQFRNPSGLAIDPNNSGFLYVSDSGNNMIRKIKIQ